VDTKHLRDIIEIYPLINLGIIPRYQYTARDVVTGTTFIAYAEELKVDKLYEIYLSPLNLAQDTWDSIRGGGDNYRQWARIHWFYLQKERLGLFFGGGKFW